MTGQFLIIVLAIFKFFLGLAIGSFLNAAAFRYKERGWLKSLGGRSRCFHCGKNLSWHELVPLVSFAIQKGRCRSCGVKLSWQYPVVELLSGLIALALPPIWWLPIYVLILIALIDYRLYVIPDSLILILAGWGLFDGLVLSGVEGLAGSISAAATAAAFFGLIVVITRGRGMGMGDVKLAGALGLWLGLPGIFYTLGLAFIIGGVFGVALLLTRRKKIKDVVPFGPFLTLGVLLTIFIALIR